MAEARIDVGGRALAIEVKPGEAVHLRGGNGSGKTSLLRALAGLRPGGRVQGTPTHTMPVEVVAQQVAYVPEEAKDGLVGLTVAGERRLRGLAPGSDGKEIAAMSTGEAGRLALSLIDGPLWLLDEPVAGLDEDAIDTLRQTITARGDAAVVFVDQTGRLADLADRTIDLGGTDGTPHADDPAWGPELATRPADEAYDLPLPALRLHAGVQGLHGPNGSGKSTLLRRAAGLDGDALHVAGRVGRLGTDIRLLLPDGRDHLGAERVADELAAAAPEVVARLVPEALMTRHPLTLSRGEAQRVALAKVLGVAAHVYLLDEPTGHLDAAGQAAFHDVLRLRATSAVLVAGPTTPWREAARCGP